jgi:3-dehydroquinate synthetase
MHDQARILSLPGVANSDSMLQDKTLKQRTIRIGDVSIPYYWGYSILEQIAAVCAPLRADRYFVVVDRAVEATYGEEVRRSLAHLAPVSSVSIASGETNKSWKCLQKLCNEFLRLGATRRTHIVAVGGGVVGNLAGLAAALTFRGLPLLHVPTTLVAAFDSVLSLKQAINSPHGKNHLGTYHTPTLIFVDLSTFSTLAERDLLSGLGEVIKNVLTTSPHTIPELLKHARKEARRDKAALSWFLESSVDAKTRVLIGDAEERLSGVLLEYGHTVGHAVEFLDARARGAAAVSHGEAVVLGMLVAARVSELALASDQELFTQHQTIVGTAGLNDRFPSCVESRQLARMILHDNKRGYIPCAADEVPMVLLQTLGRPNYQGKYPLTRVPVKTVSYAALEFIRK